ncbi:hypothetical protein ACA910_011081 [Epithemia clementina (nom. ined.)]
MEMRKVALLSRLLVPVLITLLSSQRTILAFQTRSVGCYYSSLVPKSYRFSRKQEFCLESESTKSADRKVDSADSSLQFSKSKWKKKRFLMIKDVNAAVQTKNARAATKAEEMVRRMWSLYENSGGADEFRPDLQCYNLWIHAVAKSNHQTNHRQKRSSINNNNNIIEDVDSFRVGERAELILQEMRDRGIEPNVVSYTTVMDAYANQARLGDPKAPAQAERVLFELLERSEYTSNLEATPVTSDTVINAWAQQGTLEGAKKAQEILERLEAMSMTAGGSTSSSRRTSTPLRPTAHSYATVIYAWANSGGGTDAAQKASAILDRLLHARRNSKDAVRPDTVIFNAAIAAWASSGDPQCGTKADEILRQMQELHNDVYHDCQPDVVTYNSVLSAWSRSGHINAAVQAERILKEMILKRKEDPEKNPAPNVISYNTVLNAWSKSTLDGAQDRAETLLKFMARPDQSEIVPDLYSYSSVLNAIAKSKQPGKALRAKKLLDYMLDESSGIKHAELTPVPFNAVINAAAFSAVGTSDEEKREALQIAVTTLSLMRKHYVKPDSISYGNALKALANLMPSGKARYDMAIQLFTTCCEEGLVQDLAWNEVQRCAPLKYIDERLNLGSHVVSLRDLPKAWRRNTRFLSRKRRDQSPPGLGNSDSSINDLFSATAPPDVSRHLRRPVTMVEPSYQSGRDM